MGISSPRNGISLCAGGGGLDMGIMLAEPGFHTRAFVEWEGYPRSTIIAAQRAGYFAPAPIWDDLTTFDAQPLAGAIDTILAGYPCQPFSMAGQRKGADDPRHLWPHVARVARELGDGLRWIFLENVSGHASLGADAVLRELRDMGFTPAVGLFSAEEVGATHERLRWFCVAYREGRGRGIGGDAAQSGRGGYADSGDVDLADPDGGNPGAEWQRGGGQQRFQPEGGSDGARIFPPGPGDAAAWGDTIATAPHLAPATSIGDCFAWARDVAQAVEGQSQAQAQSALCRMADGLASRPRALRLLGNGVVPLAAAYAWRTLSAAHGLGALDLDGTGAATDTDASKPVRRYVK